MFARRASTPCLSFSSLEESSFKADRTDAAMSSPKSALSFYSEASKQRRKSLGDFGTPLPLVMPPLRNRPGSATAMSLDLAKVADETTKIMQEPLVVEDERTALTRCMNEELQAKKSLVFAMTQPDPSVLAEAIANARLKGVDNDKLVKAEATLKQLRATKVRKQIQKCGSSSSLAPLNGPLISTLPEASNLKPRSSSKPLNHVSISPEAQAALAGMMEAQSFCEDHKTVDPSMQRRRRASTSLTSEAQSFISQACEDRKAVGSSMQRRRRGSTSLTSIRMC